MLQGHYASTLDFSNTALQAAEKGLERLMKSIQVLENIPTSGETDSPEANIEDLKSRCAKAMGDDFNTPILISVLFDAIKLVNKVQDGRIIITAAQKEALKTLIHGYTFDVLGLEVESEMGGAESDDTGALLDLLVQLRSDAKTNKDWGTADSIRNALSDIGVTIKDGKEGSTWNRD